MTTPSDLTTLELVIELTLARAWMQDTHAQLPMAAAARYVAIQAEAAERFKNSWIMTGVVLTDFHGQPPAPQITQEEFDQRSDAPKHHLTFDFPNHGPTARDL